MGTRNRIAWESSDMKTYTIEISDRERVRHVSADTAAEAVKKAIGKRLVPDSVELDIMETEIDHGGNINFSVWWANVKSLGPKNPREIRLVVRRKCWAL